MSAQEYKPTEPVSWYTRALKLKGELSSFSSDTARVSGDYRKIVNEFAAGTPDSKPHARLHDDIVRCWERYYDCVLMLTLSDEPITRHAVEVRMVYVPVRLPPIGSRDWTYGVVSTAALRVISGTTVMRAVAMTIGNAVPTLRGNAGDSYDEAEAIATDIRTCATSMLVSLEDMIRGLRERLDNRTSSGTSAYDQTDEYPPVKQVMHSMTGCCEAISAVIRHQGCVPLRDIDKMRWKCMIWLLACRDAGYARLLMHVSTRVGDTGGEEALMREYGALSQLEDRYFRDVGIYKHTSHGNVYMDIESMSTCLSCVEEALRSCSPADIREGVITMITQTQVGNGGGVAEREIIAYMSGVLLELLAYVTCCVNALRSAHI